MNNQIAINVSGAHGLVPYTYKTVVLKPNVVDGKNILTQLMMGQTNTKYVIKYDYVIDPDIQTGIASVSESNISHCVNPNYAAALAAYNLAHDAWIDADNAYTNNPNDTTLAAKNAAYAAYTAAQTTLNNTPQFYYYAANAILVKQGQYIGIPKGCVLLNASLSGITDFVVAPADTTVYIGSLTAGEYNYTVQNAIVIPSGCLIEFDGGSISNGVLVGDETILIFDQEEEVVLKNVELLGEFEYSAGGSGGVDKKDNVDGMATITLKKNKNFASQLTQTNTIYRIMYDFDLGNERVTVPENCVLEFDGGSISNGVLTGQNTVIGEDDKVRIFGDDLSLAGTWNVKEGYPQWFGCVPDDNSIDTTPAIKKLVAVSIPIFFCAGVWYLSECLLHGNKNVILKGFSHAFNVRTYFRPFTAGQRFILKLGGYADFSPVTNETYAENSCRNFEVSGISFYVPSNKKLINADQTGTYQNYAALCFDWCSEGHVDVSVYETFSPTLFIANSWEICFDNVEVYGSYTEMQEYAIYFGRAYTSVKASNISQIKMLNIFGENIWGHLIGNKNANIVDLVINNIEAEIMPNLRPTTPISDAIGYIRNNVRTVDKYYMIELGGSHVYIMNCDIQLQDFAFTHDNTDYIMGSVLATDNLTIGVLANGRNARNTIVGTINSMSQLQIEEVNGYKYNDGSYPASLLTIAPQIDFTDHNYFINNLDKLNCGIFVGRSNIIQNIDLIKEYGPGLLFDADTYSEVTSLRVWNNNLFVLESIINGVIYKFLSVYNGVKTLDRKMKFKDTSALRITYTGRNYYQNTDDVIVITYYKNGEVVETGSFGMPYSDDVISFDIELYQGNYDYCTFKINGVLSIKSVYVLEKVVEKEQVVVFGSEISSDVLGIMSHYARDDAYKRTALQYFFDTIGNIKNKLNHLILPIFADNITEAIYDIITGQPLTNIDGGNYLEFNKPTRRVHVSTPNIEGQWRRWSYRLYNPTSTFEGAMVIMSATNNLGTGEGGHPTAPVMYGAVFYLNNSSVGEFVPRTTDNVKIIGGGIVGDSEDRYYLRVGDTLGSDRVTAFTTFQDWWDDYTQPFGQMPLDKTRGVRILVSSDQLLTKDEADILRDAVLALDNKFAILDDVNDNYTPAVEKLLIPNSGTWDNKPSYADISVGFAYFCTDKQTTEGATDGIQIFYKGEDTTDPDNPVDVWVDALGRVVS